MPTDRGSAASLALGLTAGIWLACGGGSAGATGALSEQTISSAVQGDWRAETRAVYWSGDLPWDEGDRVGLAVTRGDGEWMRFDLPPGILVTGGPTWSADRVLWQTDLGAIEVWLPGPGP